MTAGNYWDRIGMLRSKVARRMFLVFVGCALLPAFVLAAVAFVDVRDYLDALSEKRLRQASKSAGMTIVERVSFLESDLHLIAVSVNLAPSRTWAPGNAERSLGDRIVRRFRSLALVDDDGRVVTALSGPPLSYRAPTAAQRAHLQAGGMLVTTARLGSRHAVLAAVLLDPSIRGGGLLAGEVDPAYLWGEDGLASPSAELCVLGEGDEPLYTSISGDVPLRQVQAARASRRPSGRFEWEHGGNRYVSGYWTIFMASYLAEWVLVQSELRDEMQQPLWAFGWKLSLVVLLTFWVVTFATLRQIRRSTIPIEQLQEATQKLKAQDFSYRVRISSGDEFALLGDAFNEMTESIERHLRVMDTINRIGVSLSAERDEARLLETVLFGAQEVFNADGAGLFLLSGDGPRLALARVRSLALGRDTSRLAQTDDSPFDTAAVPALRHATERTIASPDVYADTSEDFSALLEFDRRTGYRTRSLMSVPLRSHDNEVMGIVLLINPQARTSGAIVPFSDEDQRLMESLASQAAVAITKNRLVQDFKGLFEGMTDLISTAIDEQSPHTGGHVRRVVVLSTMIAEAMSRSADAEVRARALSEEELYELRIAALLHDCGKLTTPVHLTDKATKLQAIVDRMWLVEARAETARRQFRVGLLEDILRRLVPDGERALAGVEVRTADFDRQLHQDLATLRECNRGAEHMPDEMWTQVCAIIGRYAWVNRRGEAEALVSADEMYHLSTRAGTLTREEREIVQGHVLSTMRMLERLPYPKRLRNVPVYAAAHHEQISGNGYPLQLAGDEIPIQGRIIAIADVLEALTARDRPYRNAMDLGQAMAVLGQMAAGGAIDRSLYDLIVSEDIHERYAREYLHLETPANHTGAHSRA